MSSVPWHLFQGRQSRAHLVVGEIVQADGPVGGKELTAAQSVLTRLVRTQKLAGDYAADGSKGCRPSGVILCF